MRHTWQDFKRVSDSYLDACMSHLEYSESRDKEMHRHLKASRRFQRESIAFFRKFGSMGYFELSQVKPRNHGAPSYALAI